MRPRAHLVARLMHERSVPRFIVAPTGFGKTHLALEYAQTVFGLEHVSWVDGKSPCFLRDLDGGHLAERLQELDPDLALAVFDDLPRLSGSRADEFSRVIDELLLASCEVLVATTPSCDAYSRRQSDRIRVGFDQLLVCERDQDWSEGLGKRPAHARIPLLAWGPADAADQLVRGMVQEDLPDQVSLALFVLLAVQSGRIEDVRYRVQQLSEDALRVLEREYLALGLSPDRETFEAVDVSVDTLRRVFSSRLDGMVAHAQVADRSELAAIVAQVLLDAGDRARACDLIRAFALRRPSADWLALHEAELISMDSLASVCLLAEASAAPKGVEGQRMALAQAWRFHLMGMDELARERLAPLSGRAHVIRSVRGWALCLGILISDVERAVALSSDLTALFSQGEGEADQSSVDKDQLMPGFPAAWGEWVAVARVLCSLVRENADPDLLWEGVSADDLTEACRDLLATILLGQGSAAAAAFVCRRVETLADRYDLGRRPALMLASVRCLGSTDPNVRAFALGMNPAALDSVIWADAEVSNQAWLFRKSIQVVTTGFGTQVKRKVSVRRPGAAERRPEATHVPQLHIRLIGGLVVLMDGRDVSSDFLRRRKVCSLLCLLALNVGREVPRDRVVQTLWPEKDAVSSVKNLYSVWSSLRALLKVGQACPYLERTQGGFRLEAANVTVDVSQVRDLCRTLRLEIPDPATWRSLLADFDDLVSGVLLPSETVNPVVLHEREALATRLVDALLSSAEKLLDMGEIELAREFAGRALEQGQEREDAYYLNMRCLLACGHREAAISMYFRNRTFLAETLGIDPSAKVIELYRSILEDEEPF
ncbi:MAG: BTAD domain-containing putative transcriptional regulator [Coriobacteriia bacterium]|nr:BTAD domain-containing putative transcriptional regulator [Coriobacteriia bacterium]